MRRRAARAGRPDPGGKSSDPWWNHDSRNRSERGSNGAISRTSATSASSGRSTSMPCRPPPRVRRLGVDAQARPSGQRGPASVLQQRHRPGLGGIPLVAEVLATHRRGGRVLVDERVVEEPEPELHGEEAAGRLVDALLGDPALCDEVEQDVDALLAAELVGAGVQDELHPAVRVEVLDAPRARRQHLVADVVVVDELPVGDDDAVVAELLAQQARDDLLVVAEADLLDFSPSISSPIGMP